APPGREPATRRQVVQFLLGVATLWVAADWPLDDLSENVLLSAHMVQFLLLAMVAPGLLLLGLPAWLLRWLLEPRPLRRLARFLRRPGAAWLVVSVILVASHWPPVVSAYLASDRVHLLMHVAWVTSGLVLWWPVLSPLPEAPRLEPPARIGYLFLQLLLPTLPASFLTFGSTPLYAEYAAMPRLWGLTAIGDQQLAGLLMKLVGSGIIIGVMAVTFFRWVAREEAADRRRRRGDRPTAPT
ncbi:MAG: cytochrome c oxidase assembly protein, partial [Nitriliruptorales bacterium]